MENGVEERAFLTVAVKETDPTWIVSPGFPSSTYPPNVNIQWLVGIQRDYILLFIFQPLDLEYQEDCLYDYIAVTDERTDESKRICGNWSWLSYSVSSNSSKLHFSSDNDKSFIGFNVSWLAIDKSLIKNRTLALGSNQTRGLVTSPNYPISYLNTLDHWIKITAEGAYRIWLVLEDLQLNTVEDVCSDYLLIYTDERNSSPRPLCSSSLTWLSEREYLSKWNYSFIFFHTNDFNNAQGFRIAYQLGKDIYKIHS